MISNMTTARFFCDTDLTCCDSLELPDAVAHHIRVRRLREGDPVILFDGKGRQAHATLGTISRASCQAQIHETFLKNRELRGKITIVQAMASQDKMDWIIEKATELGAHKLIAVQAHRSVVKLNSDRARKRAAHGQRIVESASEQCGRNHLMQLQMPLSLKDAITQCRDHPMLACILGQPTRPLEDTHLLDLIRQNKTCAIFIGPEGGWAPHEQVELTEAGAIGVTLGKRVLRTETAGLAAISALTALLGWDS